MKTMHQQWRLYFVSKRGIKIDPPLKKKPVECAKCAKVKRQDGKFEQYLYSLGYLKLKENTLTAFKNRNVIINVKFEKVILENPNENIGHGFTDITYYILHKITNIKKKNMKI